MTSSRRDMNLAKNVIHEKVPSAVPIAGGIFVPVWHI